MLTEYISRKKIRSEKTAKTYISCINRWAKMQGSSSPDELISKIKNGQVDPYVALQSTVSDMVQKKLAPKTILTYYAAIKGFLLAEDIELTENKLKNKITLPQTYAVSTDRAPTPEEMQTILEYATSSPSTKLAILMLATSGLRIAELSSLKVRDVEIDRQEGPAMIKLSAKVTKTRKERRTFMTQEAAKLLRDYLGDRNKNPDDKIFQVKSDALYARIMRTISRAQLKVKSDPESKRYELHPHCFRKLFFTTLLGNGIDRGIVEGFMGHTFGLDQSYLRMSDDELRGMYGKAANRLLFGQTDVSLQQQMKQQTQDIRELKTQILQMQIREIEKRLHIDSGTPIEEMEIPYPDDPTNEREQEEYDQLMKDRQDYEKEEHERLARLKKQLAALESS